MKLLMGMLLMTALCAVTPLAQAQDKAADAKKAAAPANAAADELKQLENDWEEAVKAKNAEKLGDILADSWAGLGWDGRREDKAKALADLKAPGNSLDTLEMGPMKVRIFGSPVVSPMFATLREARVRFLSTAWATISAVPFSSSALSTPMNSLVLDEPSFRSSTTSTSPARSRSDIALRHASWLVLSATLLS